MSKTLDVVIDTQVFLRSLINPKSRAGRLIHEQQADYTLWTTDQMDHEIIDVLNRPRIRAKFPQITDTKVDTIRLLLEQANRVEVTSDDIEPVCRDPKDDIFLACAKKAGADYLVSEDNDLLVLKQYAGVQIVTVSAFLQVLA